MKIAISGKGGVGKTTLTALLIGAAAVKNRRVIAIDADPDANLASAFGIPPGKTPTPISLMRDLIEERTGSKGDYGGYFKLNPEVDDLPEKYAIRIGGFRLLVLGGVTSGGSGCICPATALIKALLTHLVLGRDEDLIMDMEAGIEHLGRATGQTMDALVVVVDPGPWSATTAHRVRELAGDIGLKNIFAVANRVTDAAQVDEIRGRLGDVPLIGSISHDAKLIGPLFSTDDENEIVPAEGINAHLVRAREILGEIEDRI